MKKVTMLMMMSLLFGMNSFAMQPDAHAMYIRGVQARHRRQSQAIARRRQQSIEQRRQRALQNSTELQEAIEKARQRFLQLQEIKKNVKSL